MEEILMSNDISPNAIPVHCCTAVCVEEEQIVKMWYKQLFYHFKIPPTSQLIHKGRQSVSCVKMQQKPNHV